MTQPMDAVDTQQQKEIDDLKDVNRRQDGTILGIIWAFVLFAVIQFTSGIMLWYSLDKECPHKDCPHHAAAK